MNTIGESGQATNLYLQANYRFIQDKNYDDAIESCRKGINIDPDSGTNTVLACTMVRAYFLNENYPECLEILKKLETSEMLLMQGKRNLLSWPPMKREFENDDKQVYVGTLNRSLNVLKKNGNLSRCQSKGFDRSVLTTSCATRLKYRYVYPSKAGL
jgi:hypothetical protein